MTPTPKKKAQKLKQSETIVIKRSQINFAPYNPRKKNPKVVEALKANFKKVGFMGGIQWNKTTRNLIGGQKRTEALDLIFDYDGTPEKDYDVKVEMIELDEKTEKEQNLFLNNKRVQGEMDLELVAAMLPEINIEATGLEQYDIDLIKATVPDFHYGEITEIKTDINNLNKNSAANKEKIKALKKTISAGVKTDQTATHFTVAFEDYSKKAEYLESLGINGDTILISAERFFKAIQPE
jgi:hypothetical protein